MQALLAGEQLRRTPQWLMGFSSGGVAERLMPPSLLYDGYGEYPESGAYPFSTMGERLLSADLSFNRRIDRVAFPIGWGANAAFGHCGPGEFNKTVIDKSNGLMIVQYETGARREIRFRPHNVRIFDLPIQDEADLSRLDLPDPEDPKRYQGFAEDVAWAKARDEWTVGWVNGFFSGVHYFLRDYAEFFVDLMLNPDFARAMIKAIGDWTLTAARKMCEAGVDCIGFCDDLGSGESLLMSPALYRDFFWPWHKRLCDLAHGFGAVVHMHSHGAIMPILPDIAAAGIDILNPLDPNENLPLDEVRAAVGPKLAVCGGMNKYFFEWSKDEQAAHLHRVIEDGRKYGPHILMESGGIPENVGREEFEWFLATSAELRSR